MASGGGVLGQLGLSRRGRHLTRVGVRIMGALLALLLLTALIWDVRRSPEDQWTAHLLLIGIDAYQRILSPNMARVGVRCRFEPTCSHYAEAVIRQDGALRGSSRTARRLVRCGPWTPAGTLDQP